MESGASEDASNKLLHKEFNEVCDQLAQQEERVTQQCMLINDLRLKLDSRTIDSEMLVSLMLY